MATKNQTTEIRLKNLKPGDTVYRIMKSRLSDGIVKYTIIDEWKEDSHTKEHTIHCVKDDITPRSFICVPISSFSKTSYVTRTGSIWGTSEIAAVKAAEKFILKDLKQKEKNIDYHSRALTSLRKEKSSLEQMLKSVSTEQKFLGVYDNADDMSVLKNYIGKYGGNVQFVISNRHFSLEASGASEYHLTSGDDVSYYCKDIDKVVELAQLYVDGFIMNSLRDYGDLYTVDEFRKMIANGFVTSYDGTGYYATTDYESKTTIDMLAVAGGFVPKRITHIKWYNS